MILVVVVHAVVNIPRRSERLGKGDVDGAVTVRCHTALVVGDVGNTVEVILTTIEPIRTVR